MTYAGLSNTSGRIVEGIDHLRQSVRDILATPLRSRVMRRDYGSGLADLIDGNLTPLTVALIKAAVLDALDRWEPRLKITRVVVEAAEGALEDGRVAITLEGSYLPEGREIVLDGVVV